MRVHEGALVVVERAGLVDDLGRDPDLPHVVEECRELRHPLLAGVEPEPLGDREDELDDVPAVRAGVGVVRLDHVAEQVRRPLVRVLQLEHRVVLLPALGRDASRRPAPSGAGAAALPGAARPGTRPGARAVREQCRRRRPRACFERGSAATGARRRGPGRRWRLSRPRTAPRGRRRRPGGRPTALRAFRPRRGRVQARPRTSSWRPSARAGRLASGCGRRRGAARAASRGRRRGEASAPAARTTSPRTRPRWAARRSRETRPRHGKRSRMR